MVYLFVFWQTVNLQNLINLSKLFFVLLFFLRADLIFCMVPGDSLIYIEGISVIGNKITNASIIYKELTFKEGDTISGDKLHDAFERSRENLLNTALFNFVSFTHSESGGPSVQVFISVVERWYIWPTPIFEHAERNLGTFIHDPDWNRINYGGQIDWNNFRGRREELFLKLRLGYKEQYEISYIKPNIGKNQQHGIELTYNHTRQHEVNLSTENNKPVYLRNDQSYLSEVINPYIKYTYRQSLYSRHFITGAFYASSYRDSATHEYFTGMKYGNNPAFIYAEYAYEYDFRDSKSYPLEGNYFRINLRRRESVTPGWNEFSKSSIVLTAGNHSLLKGRFYFNNVGQVYLSKDIYEPKFFRTGLGYGPYLRGYELNVIDGNSYGLFVNNFKYCIMQEKSEKLGYIPWSQFNLVHFSIYANLFFDMAYVRGQYYASDGNTYVNRFLYTGGIGFDLVSYYDLVLRIETSVNREGRPGFFIHTEVPFGRW